MKSFIILVASLLYCGFLYSQGAAVNTTGSVADPSAMLDISSDNRGILIPRMTEAQKNAIVNPSLGLMIYQKDNIAGFWYWNGTSWVQSLGQTGAAGATGNTGATGFLTPGSSAGITPYWNGTQWVVNSSNIYNNGGSVGIGTNNPNASSKFDIVSTSGGLLIPRMTTNQRNSISAPAEGLQIFNVTTKCFEFYADNLWQSVKCSFNCGVSQVSFVYRGASVSYGTVSGQNGTCWFDRNLGATAIATAYNHVAGYGDIFQWGRLDDGHQSRSSTSTSTLSSNDNPQHSKFILASSSSPYDWRSPQNNNLWQDVAGTNNPCPAGWRLPVETEINNERLAWSPAGYNGAIASSLKLPAGGYRHTDGGFNSVGDYGSYWSSTIDSYNARSLGFASGSSGINSTARATACSVRCIMDY